MTVTRTGNKTVQQEDYPPPYPNGWYGILQSYQLAKSQVANIKIFGQDLAVFVEPTASSMSLMLSAPTLGLIWQSVVKLLLTLVSALANLSVHSMVGVLMAKGMYRFHTLQLIRQGLHQEQVLLVKEVNQQILIWFTCECV